MTGETAISLPLHEQAVMRKIGIPLRNYVDNKKGYFVCKRCLDVALSLAVMALVLSWALPILALLIKCTSKGPVFFLQKRVGFGGRSFTCYKLRTMIANPMAHEQPASLYDVRITRLGHFLRCSNLDELPQFFNVLMGHMSIVGPRPHMHADCRTFASLIPGYKFRNLVKPGITGLAQVKGYHGSITHPADITKRYEWDAFYIRHAGFKLDLSIMMMTAGRLVKYLIKD